jgi:PAS domain S-box-containing protein/putative nucleotidyltransferase with HDIG domain
MRSQGGAAERLLSQIDMRYNETLLVKEIGQATSMILDIDKLLMFAVETLEKRLDFDRGMIMLANKDRTLLQYMVGYGYNPEHEGYLRETKFHLEREGSTGPAVMAFKKQTPFLVNNIKDIDDKISSSSLEFARIMGAESFICVPIIYEKESMGVLFVDNLKSKRRLTQSDISILLGIAPQIAISIKNALSYQAIMESEERFRSLSENAPDIIYTLGTDGSFTYVNPAWERILGHPARNVLGKHFASFMREEDAPGYIRLLDLVKHERRIFRDEIAILVHYDGSYRHFSISSAPNLDAEDNVIGFVGIFKDITDLKISQEQLRKSYQKLQGTLDVTIQAISMIVEARDPYTAGHQERVARLSSAIAREMGLPEERIKGIRMAALIHDIGKINVPAEILSKPTRLNEIELSLIQAHPQVGYNILKTIDFSFPVEKVVLQHHERLNGSGYPSGLSGDDILLEARILSVSDVVESMASHRPYRPALGIDAALEAIQQSRGIGFDPDVVDACVNLFQKKTFKF